MKQKPLDQEWVCKNCSYKKSDHRVVNYADEPMISREVLICPSSVFRPGKEKK